MLPDNAATLLRSGVEARNRGDLKQAAADLNAAYAIYPNSPRMWQEMARTCIDGRDFQRAASIMEDVAKVQPNAPEVRYELGLIYETTGDYDRALVWHEEAIRVHRKRQITKGLGLALMGRGACYARLGDQSASRLSFDAALKVNDTSPAHRFGAGLARLARGDWVRGWRDLEARWELQSMWKQQRGHGTEKGALPPRWDGKSPGRVLLYAEQGSGDTLWALRFLPAVEDAKLMVQPELVTLTQSLTNRHVIPNGPATNHGCAWSAPLLSLPYIVGASAPCAPWNVLNRWSSRAGANALRVGVCWHGEPKHGNDKDRSCPESLLHHIAVIPGVEAVSLQHGEPRPFKDFLDTAMLMHSLDMVVTVDTAIAHLAGTLGVPTIVLPPTVPDWRWPLSYGDECPWYPSIRLVRRARSKDWAPAIDRVVDLLTLETMRRDARSQ